MKYIKLDRNNNNYQVDKRKKGYWQVTFKNDDGEKFHFSFRPETGPLTKNGAIVFNIKLLRGNDSNNAHLFVIAFKPATANDIGSLMVNVDNPVEETISDKEVNEVEAISVSTDEVQVEIKETIKNVVEKEEKPFDIQVDNESVKVSAKGLIPSLVVSAGLLALTALSVRFLNRNM